MKKIAKEVMESVYSVGSMTLAVGYVFFLGKTLVL